MKFMKAMLVTMLITLLIGGGAIAVVHFDIFVGRDEDAVPVAAEIFEEIPEVVYEPYFEAVYIYAAEYPEEYYEEECDICPYTVTILISAGGDVTLGGDRRHRGYHAFMREFADSGYNHAHFFSNIAHIFYESCIAVVNLEGALTDITSPHMDKEFVFRGPPHFAQILSEGNVDIVTIANNHTQDFFRRGYYDTLDALRAVGVLYFGNEFYTIMDVNGISVGFFGHRVWADTAYNRDRVTGAIEYLRAAGAQLIIAFNHWGDMRQPARPYQISMGRFTIDAGADLVLGAHPHMIQGIEEYNGRYIVYSLADFSFGGHANPSDQDSFIFQQTFTFYRGELQPENDVNIIPILISSVRTHNDFRPTPAEGADAERIMARIERYSAALGE